MRKEFGGEDNKTIKMVKLKRLEQKNKIIEKFIQEFRRAERESDYEGRLLIKKFKQEINRVI